MNTPPSEMIATYHQAHSQAGTQVSVSVPNRSAFKKLFIQGMVCYAHSHGEVYTLAPDPPSNRTEAAILPGLLP